MGLGSAVLGARISFFFFFFKLSGTEPAPSLRPVPDVTLVQRLFQGVLSY